MMLNSSNNIHRFHRHHFAFLQPPNDKVVTTEELVFNEISYEASGKYTCLAVNELGKASANINIQVECMY